MCVLVRIVRRILANCAPRAHDVRMGDRARDERGIGYVRARGTASVEELSRELGVGPSTIRRDLLRLR
jgi:hypothetical protein